MEVKDKARRSPLDCYRQVSAQSCYAFQRRDLVTTLCYLLVWNYAIPERKYLLELRSADFNVLYINGYPYFTYS